MLLREAAFRCKFGILGARGKRGNVVLEGEKQADTSVDEKEDLKKA